MRYVVRSLPSREVIDDSSKIPVAFTQGSRQVLPCIDEAVLQMRPGGKAYVHATAEWAYGAAGGDVEVELTLVECVRFQAHYSMELDEKMGVQARRKEEGNALFKTGRYKEVSPQPCSLLVTSLLVTSLLVRSLLVTSLLVTSLLVTSLLVTSLLVTSLLVTSLLVTSLLVTSLLVTSLLVTSLLVAFLLVTSLLVAFLLVTSLLVAFLLVTSRHSSLKYPCLWRPSLQGAREV